MIEKIITLMSINTLHLSKVYMRICAVLKNLRQDRIRNAFYYYQAVIIQLLLRQRLFQRNLNPYYKWQLRWQRRIFFEKLKDRAGTWLKTTEDSKEIYDKYDDREQRDYEGRSTTCVYNNKVVKKPIKEIRWHYLDYLFSEIKPLISESRPIKILEVGCGNCINLVSLKRELGKAVELYGIDISEERLNVARNYFTEALEGIKLYPCSITQTTPWRDSFFDVVFTMHCLEQIPYKSEIALREMYRLANKVLVMIEPVFELGNPAQRLYLINADRNRILLRTLRHLGYQITRLEPLNIQSNPVNQSSIIVVKKRKFLRRPKREKYSNEWL